MPARVLDISAIFSDFILWKAWVNGSCHTFIKLLVPQTFECAFWCLLLGYTEPVSWTEKIHIAFLNCAAIVSGLTPDPLSTGNCFISWVSLSGLALVILNLKRKVGSDSGIHTDFRLMINNVRLH